MTGSRTPELTVARPKCLRLLGLDHHDSIYSHNEWVGFIHTDGSEHHKALSLFWEKWFTGAVVRESQYVESAGRRRVLLTNHHFKKNTMTLLYKRRS